MASRTLLPRTSSTETRRDRCRYALAQSAVSRADFNFQQDRAEADSRLDSFGKSSRRSASATQGKPQLAVRLLKSAKSPPRPIFGEISGENLAEQIEMAAFSRAFASCLDGDPGDLAPQPAEAFREVRAITA
jgi:hypothetical protein